VESPSSQRQIRFFSSLCQLIEITAESMLTQQGDTPLGMFILISGSVQGSYIYHDKYYKLEKKFDPGDVLGEIGCYLNCKRSASLVCDTSCSLLFLNRCYMDYIKVNCKLLYKSLGVCVAAYKDVMVTSRRRLLRTAIFYLKHAHNRVLGELAFNISEKDFEQGSIIAKQFDLTNDYLFIESG